MMLEVEDLHSGYDGIPVLTGLSLQVAEGAFVGSLQESELSVR